jgi:hypothetical protein
MIYVCQNSLTTLNLVPAFPVSKIFVRPQCSLSAQPGIARWRDAQQVTSNLYNLSIFRGNEHIGLFSIPQACLTLRHGFERVTNVERPTPNTSNWLSG